MKNLKKLIDEMKAADINLLDDNAIWNYISVSDYVPEYIDEDVNPVEELFIEVMQELEKGEAGIL